MFFFFLLRKLTDSLKEDKTDASSAVTNKNETSTKIPEIDLSAIAKGNHNFLPIFRTKSVQNESADLAPPSTKRQRTDTEDHSDQAGTSSGKLID